VNTLKNCLHNE